jgi:hypothetical protein
MSVRHPFPWASGFYGPPSGHDGPWAGRKTQDPSGRGGVMYHFNPDQNLCSKGLEETSLLAIKALFRRLLLGIVVGIGLATPWQRLDFTRSPAKSAKIMNSF